MRTLRLACVLLPLTITVASCTPATVAPPVDEVIFLTAVAPETVQMEALFEGRVLADSRGCLRLDTETRQTVVWPHGFRLQTVRGTLHVVGDHGRAIGSIGERFRLGGGEVPMHDGLPLSREQMRLASDVCPGKLWIVGATESSR